MGEGDGWSPEAWYVMGSGHPHRTGSSQCSPPHPSSLVTPPTKQKQGFPPTDPPSMHTSPSSFTPSFPPQQHLTLSPDAEGPQKSGPTRPSFQESMRPKLVPLSLQPLISLSPVQGCQAMSTDHLISGGKGRFFLDSWANHH